VGRRIRTPRALRSIRERRLRAMGRGPRGPDRLRRQQRAVPPPRAGPVRRRSRRRRHVGVRADGRLRLAAARRGGLGAVHERLLGVDAAVWVRVGGLRSLGLGALPLRTLGLLGLSGLVLDPRHGVGAGVGELVGRRRPRGLVPARTTRSPGRPLGSSARLRGASGLGGTRPRRAGRGVDDDPPRRSGPPKCRPRPGPRGTRAPLRRTLRRGRPRGSNAGRPRVGPDGRRPPSGGAAPTPRCDGPRAADEPGSPPPRGGRHALPGPVRARGERRLRVSRRREHRSDRAAAGQHGHGRRRASPAPGPRERRPLHGALAPADGDAPDSRLPLGSTRSRARGNLPACIVEHGSVDPAGRTPGEPSFFGLRGPTEHKPAPLGPGEPLPGPPEPGGQGAAGGVVPFGKFIVPLRRRERRPPERSEILGVSRRGRAVPRRVGGPEVTATAEGEVGRSRGRLALPVGGRS
jgi:hypothetical protein